VVRIGRKKSREQIKTEIEIKIEKRGAKCNLWQTHPPCESPPSLVREGGWVYDPIESKTRRGDEYA
jgi:hypothetical protein